MIGASLLVKGTRRGKPGTNRLTLASPQGLSREFVAGASGTDGPRPRPPLLARKTSTRVRGSPLGRQSEHIRSKVATRTSCGGQKLVVAENRRGCSPHRPGGIGAGFRRSADLDQPAVASWSGEPRRPEDHKPSITGSCPPSVASKIRAFSSSTLPSEAIAASAPSARTLSRPASLRPCRPRPAPHHPGRLNRYLADQAAGSGDQHGLAIPGCRASRSKARPPFRRSRNNRLFGFDPRGSVMPLPSVITARSAIEPRGNAPFEMTISPSAIRPIPSRPGVRKRRAPASTYRRRSRGRPG